MKRFFTGLIVGFLLIPVIFVLLVVTGRMPVATSDPSFPLEKFLAGAGQFARIHKEAPKLDVSGYTPADLLNGADVYQKNCAVCHGLPQQPETGVAKGMFPPPPQLFTEKDSVVEDPPGVTYWRVKNGIRLTGMPGFHASLSEQQILHVTALVERADKLPPEVLDALKPVPPPMLISAGAAAPAAAATQAKPAK
jgi:thiosulfate dehydrogenase